MATTQGGASWEGARGLRTQQVLLLRVDSLSPSSEPLFPAVWRSGVAACTQVLTPRLEEGRGGEAGSAAWGRGTRVVSVACSAGSSLHDS